VDLEILAEAELPAAGAMGAVCGRSPQPPDPQKLTTFEDLSANNSYWKQAVLNSWRKWN